MRLVREGHAGALDQITRCYSRRLFEAGRRHCRTREEAEDAVQDAMRVAAESLGSLRRDASLEGWLVQVVSSACRRLSRGAKNDFARHDVELTLTASGTPEEDAQRNELSAALERMLLELSPVDRSILLLAELEGYSAAEIGAELGLTAGAVRTRLSRLRPVAEARLKRELSIK
ncbi:MAG TPA: sigma-70 family RNA polymerase sigma factor [Polyangiaceae bacterium]|nr:sigma-70 family RNA polymerase sigma factor [Polyangiaceae bacterium]